MAIHIKNRWHSDNTAHSLPEIAGALAFNAWRIAQDKAISLHGEHFNYQNDQQRMSVLIEYLYFQIHIVDRLIYELLNAEERKVIIVQLVVKLTELVQDNSLDLFGTGDYSHTFMDGMNQRSLEYAEFTFNTDGPSYTALRHLGYHIQTIMGEVEENRWIIDQVMDKDGMEVYWQISKTLQGLM